jgi:hypothetical protein
VFSTRVAVFSCFSCHTTSQTLGVCVGIFSFIGVCCCWLVFVQLSILLPQNHFVISILGVSLSLDISSIFLSISTEIGDIGVGV